MKIRDRLVSMTVLITVLLALVQIKWLVGDTKAVHAAEKTDNQAIEPVEDSMHEFMEYVFEPGYKRLKANLASEPKDNSAWKNIKGDSLSIAEACNLLVLRAPEESKKDWIGHAVKARNSTGALYKAARAKDYPAAKKAFTSMLNDCNSCHKQFEDGKHILTTGF